MSVQTASAPFIKARSNRGAGSGCYRGCLLSLLQGVSRIDAGCSCNLSLRLALLAAGIDVADTDLWERQSKMSDQN